MWCPLHYFLSLLWPYISIHLPRICLSLPLSPALSRLHPELQCVWQCPLHYHWISIAFDRKDRQLTQSGIVTSAGNVILLMCCPTVTSSPPSPPHLHPRAPQHHPPGNTVKDEPKAQVFPWDDTLHGAPKVDLFQRSEWCSGLMYIASQSTHSTIIPFSPDLSLLMYGGWIPLRRPHRAVMSLMMSFPDNTMTSAGVKV